MARSLTDMKKTVGFFIITWVFIAGEAISLEGNYMDSAKADLLVKAQETLFNDRFDRADSIYSIFIEAYPEDPAGYFFKAVECYI